MEKIQAGLIEIYGILAASGWFIIGGLALAGLIHVFINPERIRRLLGKPSLGSVVKAAMVGVPLPLCSCSVIPVASGLKRDGASDGAVTAFLISTPESGVDSIAISWALLDPILTVARVLAAFITALVGGIAVMLGMKGAAEAQGQAEREHDLPDASCCQGGRAAPVAEEPHSCCGAEPADDRKAEGNHVLGRRLLASQHYAFFDLFPSLAKYFIWGLLATGVVAVLVPADYFERLAGGSIGGMLAAMLVGIPIYICATGSTPLAAALIMKGMSPGTALVLLLAGPATNLATMAVVRDMIGNRGLALYLASIGGCALMFGLVTDMVYRLFSIAPLVAGEHAQLHRLGLFEHAGAVALLLMLTASVVGPLWRKWTTSLAKVETSESVASK